MKAFLVLFMVLYTATAFAQGSPPTVGGKPLVQVKPRGGGGAAKPTSMAAKLQACLEIDDATKERLQCYDGVIAPKPKAKPPKAKAVTDCRFTKEEDERLTCFNEFVERLPKLPS